MTYNIAINPQDQVFLTEREKNLLLNLSLQCVSKKKIRAVEHFKCKSTPKFACQECRRRTRTIKVPKSPREQFIANPYRYVKRMGVLKRRILDAIIYWCKAFHVAYPSHKMIALYVGCSESHVKQSIDEFLEIGLIGQKYIGKKGKANEYEISPAFSWGWVKKQISSFFKNLTSFFIEQLMSVNKGEKKECIPNINILNTIPNISLPQEDLFKNLTRPSLNLDQAGQVCLKTKKERENMSTHIPQHLFEVKSINLTDFGRIRLSRFPQEAVEAIDIQLSQSNKDLTSPFGWFYNACKRYCEENNIEVDSMVESKLKIAYNITSDLPTLENNKINRAKKSASKQSYGSNRGSSKGNDYNPVPPHITQQANAQNAIWQETLQLRENSHSDYIERIKSLHSNFRRKKPDEEDNHDVVAQQPTELDIAYRTFCANNPEVVEREETDSTGSQNGSCFKAFLASTIGKFWLDKQKPLVRKILRPLLRTNDKAESFETDPIGSAGTAPEPTPAFVSPFTDAMWPSDPVPTPFINDDESPWEEI